MSGSSGTPGIQFGSMLDSINKATTSITSQLNVLQAKGSTLNIADMFKMQMLMNTLSQLSEMSSGLVSAMNQATMSPARAVKG